MEKKVTNDYRSSGERNGKSLNLIDFRTSLSFIESFERQAVCSFSTELDGLVLRSLSKRGRSMDK